MSLREESDEAHCDDQRLCETYLTFLRRKQDKDFWAYEKINELEYRADFASSWKILLDLISLAGSRAELTSIGVGPLENIICARGSEVFSLLEDELSENARLQWAFAAVWIAKDNPMANKIHDLQNDFDINAGDPLEGYDIDYE